MVELLGMELQMEAGMRLPCVAGSAGVEVKRVAGVGRRNGIAGFRVEKARNAVCWERRLGAARCTVDHHRDLEVVRKVAPSLDRATDGASTEWKAVPDIWKTAAEKYGDRTALLDPHRTPATTVSYKQLEQAILDFAEGLRVCGIHPDQHVALFADNSYRWLIADQGIMAAGAANAVRGSRSSNDELFLILDHSDSVALVVDNPELFNKLGPRLKTVQRLTFVVLLWGEKEALKGADSFHIPIYSYSELLASGRTSRQALAAANRSGVQNDVIRPDDVATIVYTSGTTGNPKGVMLTHGNLLHQVVHLNHVLQPGPGDKILSLLPPWHMYERAAEYFCLANGVEQVYTAVPRLKDDLAFYAPEYFIAVPLVYDMLYSAVQKKLEAGSELRKTIALGLISISMKYMDCKRISEGRALSQVADTPNPLFAAGEWTKAVAMAYLLLPLHALAQKLVYSKIKAALGIKKIGVSGGGSLAGHIDKFFEAIGITVLNGYGLTETSPVLAARVPENNVLGTVGKPLPLTEIKVVDTETGKTVAPGVRGTVKARGPQLMKGYYKNPLATSKAIDEEGWFDTGDLGWLAPESQSGPARNCGGTLVLDGRAKDTIVLSTGENVEPTQIEEAAMQSKLVQQIMVVGQDQRRLGALVVVYKEQLEGVKSKLRKSSESSEPSQDDLRVLLRSEINKFLRDGSFTLGTVALLDEPFTIENGLLTPTLKIRREAVASQYKDTISALFKQMKN